MIWKRNEVQMYLQERFDYASYLENYNSLNLKNEPSVHGFLFINFSRQD